MRSTEINALKAMGYTDAFIKTLVKSIKGKVFTIPASGNLEDSFQLPGNANILLGFRTFEVDGISAQMSILINQEKIYDSVEEFMLNCSGSALRDEYIETFRQLKGQDIINVIFSNASSATDVNVMAYFLLSKTN